MRTISSPRMIDGDDEIVMVGASVFVDVGRGVLVDVAMVGCGEDVLVESTFVMLGSKPQDAAIMTKSITITA